MDVRITNPFESLHNTIVFDSRDWAASKRDAWIWGIVVGWDIGSYHELQKKFNWSDDDCKQLVNLHRNFEIAKEKYFKTI